MDIGVFLPVGNNGWMVSSTSPQDMRSLDLHRAIVEKAKRYGFECARPMIKPRGFGGPPEDREHNLAGFTLRAGLAHMMESA